MKKLLLSLFILCGLSSISQVPYVPNNSDSIKMSVIVNGLTRSINMVDLIPKRSFTTTVAGLRAMTIVNNPKADAFYLTPDGRKWIWNSSSTETDDGGVVLDPTAISGPGRFELVLTDNKIHSKWYLNTNSKSDQSLAAQKWLDASQRLNKIAYHNKSVDTVFAKNLSPKSSIEMEEGAWFKLNSDATYINHDALFIMTDISNVTLKNIHLDGNSEKVFTDADHYCPLFRITTTNQISDPPNGRNTNIRIDGDYLRNAGAGFTVFSTNDLTITNGRDSNIDGHLIAYGFSDNIHVDRLISRGGTSEKVSFYGQDSTNRLSNASVTNSWFIDTDFGVDARFVSGFKVIGNHFIGIKRVAMYVGGGVNGYATRWQNGPYNGIISNNEFINCNSVTTGSFSYTTWESNIIDGVNTGQTMQIGLGTTYDLPGNVFVNNKFKNCTPAFNVMHLIRNVAPLISLNTFTDDRGTPYTVSQAISLDSCKKAKVLNNTIFGMKTRNIVLNACDSTVIEDINLTGQVLINSNNTNTFVPIIRNVFNGSTSTVMNVVHSSSGPSQVAAVGSTWRNLSASAGNIFWVNETGTSTWTQSIYQPPSASSLPITSAGGGSDAGYWTKIATVTPTADFNDGSMILAINGYSGGAQGAILGWGYRQNATGGSTTPYVSVLALGTGAATQMVDTGFMVVNNGYNQPFELWMRKALNFGQFTITDISKKLSSTNTVTYLSTQGWTATRPTGTYSAQSASLAGATPVSLAGTNTWTGVNTFANTVSLSGNITKAAWGVNGVGLTTAPNTYTDNSSSGTVANNYVNSFRTPTLVASNPTTYTFTCSYCFEGPPTSGTNVTQTNRYTIAAVAGTSYFQGLTVGGNQSFGIGDGTGATASASLNSRGWVGYNATSSNVALQGIAGRGIEFNVNNSTFPGGTVANFASATGNFRLGDGTAATSTAILDISSTTKGVLFPRMTTTQRTAITLAAGNDGLMVYDTDLHKLFLNENGTWVQK